MNKKIQNLKIKINRFLDTTEYGILKLSGEHLSVADCNTILIYLEAIENNTLHKLIKPIGSIANILKKNGIIE